VPFAAAPDLDFSFRMLLNLVVVYQARLLGYLIAGYQSCHICSSYVVTFPEEEFLNILYSIPVV
jgi:hypothetical protein